ncbi:hypothetical protein S83_011669 [Arachis hypogaea]
MEGKNKPPPQIFSPPFSLSISTTTINDLSFLNDDTFFKKLLTDLVKEGDFGSLPSLPPDTIVLESFETVAQSQRLKLRPSTMTSIAATTRINRRSENNLSKFSCLTESESDNLRYGYKWRKYGKKTVRNSPYPRNYYHCTAIGCNVKRRVERWLDDPTHVLTTYEGLHLHDLPPISSTLLKSFGFYNNCTTGPKPHRGNCSCRCKMVNRGDNHL